MKKLWKNIALSLLIGISLFGIVGGGTLVHAQADPEANGFYEDETMDVLEGFKKESGFNSFVGNSGPVQGEGSGGVKTLTSLMATIIGVLKYIVGGLAVFMLVITIVRLISASPDDSEEKLGDLKKHLGYIVMAVIVIISADTFFRVALDVSGSGFLADETAAKNAALAGAAEIRGIYTIIQTIVGVIAVLMLVIAGFKMVSNAGNEEATEQAKKQIIYASAGLILIAISELVVKDVLFKDGGTTLGTTEAKLLLVKFTNFASGFISFLAVLAFFYAGYLYIFSGVGEDNSEKVKKVIVGAIIGILIAAGAFAFVNTVIDLDGDNTPNYVEEQLNNV